MRARLDKDGRVERSLDLRLDSGEMDAGDAGEPIQLMIVPDDSVGALGDMITLRSASGGHGKLQLGGDGIIVAQSCGELARRQRPATPSRYVTAVCVTAK